MSTDDRRSIVLRGQVLPAEHRGDLRMPAGTPLGLGILGAARYNAIRRVIEAYARARRAQEELWDAEAGAADAYLRREEALERLRNLDTIRDSARHRVQSAYNRQVREEQAAEDDWKIADIERQLAFMEAQDRLAAAKARRKGTVESEPPKAAPQAADPFEEVARTIRSAPNLAKAARDARDDMVRDAGGEENLSEGDHDIVAQLEALAMSSIAKQAGEKILE